MYFGNGLPYQVRPYAPALVGDLIVEGTDVEIRPEPRYRAREKLLTDTLSEDEDPEFK